MKKAIISILVLIIVVSMNGCAEKIEKKSGMIINAAGDDLEHYEAGFGKYFETDMMETSQPSSKFMHYEDSRYVVVVSNDAKFLNDEHDDIESKFFIIIHDDGETVNVSNTYTSGAEAENPTIVNKNYISGKTTINSSRSFVPNEKTDAVVRAEQTAQMLHSWLVEIEG